LVTAIKMKRVLITGASGQLGRELQTTAPGPIELLAYDHARLDIADEAQVMETVQATAPTLVINAAAYTAVDRAEQEPEKAFAVNAKGTANLAQAAAVCNIRLMHISTDFVFGGDTQWLHGTDDPAAPVNTYGASKRAGEESVCNIMGEQACILRTAWVYSAHGHNFVKTMLRLMGERDSLGVVCDQIGTPTWARGLAMACWHAAALGMTGIHHWTDAGVASWYDFAVAIQEEALALGLLTRAIPVYPIDTKAYPTPAPRPASSVLDKTKTWQGFGQTADHWRVSLRGMLQEYKETLHA
jgi:dTDP-4-dehydrorhamnose reductase